MPVLRHIVYNKRHIILTYTVGVNSRNSAIYIAVIDGDSWIEDNIMTFLYIR